MLPIDVSHLPDRYDQTTQGTAGVLPQKKIKRATHHSLNKTQEKDFIKNHHMYSSGAMPPKNQSLLHKPPKALKSSTKESHSKKPSTSRNTQIKTVGSNHLNSDKAVT